MVIDQVQLSEPGKSGQRYCDEFLKSRLEPREHGRYVAIDLEARLFAVADTPVQAFDQVRAQGSTALHYLIRICHPHAVEML